MKKTQIVHLVLVVLTLIVSTTYGALAQSTAHPSQPIRMARATWDTGWFQAEIFKQLLEELGYTVEGPRTMDNAPFYTAVAAGEVDLWVNGWFPLHDDYITEAIQAEIAIVGTEVERGALQGYQVDRASAERLNIESLADFTRPEVIETFDRNGDGRAELIGCDVGWGCVALVEQHLDRYGLRATVEHVQGDYGPLMLDAIERYAQGDPLFIYTWTPNWTAGALPPGEDVSWIAVPPVPAAEAPTANPASVPNVTGCVADPCPMGFSPNDIRTVANAQFLAANPAVETLLAQVKIPLAAISAQNARMLAGEDDGDSIAGHAREWIAANRATVEQWLTSARATDPQLDQATATTAATADRATTQPTLRVVTKQVAPFVIYDVDARDYSGFSIELWEMIATEAGFDYQLYGVNSVAKLLDEVERGAADVAVAGIGITARRESYLNFSHAYFESGLQILVPAAAAGAWRQTLSSLFGGLLSAQFLSIIGLLLAALLVAAHVLWYFERNANPEFAASYWPGIWEAFWWSAVTATTVGYGDKTPKTAGGRLIALIWMFAGLFVLASFTAGVATNFALQEVSGHIAGPADLPGKRVGTVVRSTAAEFLSAQGIGATLYNQEQDAYAALTAGELDAVVYDAPVLQHYAANEGAGAVQTVGLTFRQQDYGVALAAGSPHEEAVNRALLRLVEQGEYQTLYEAWFGTEQ